MSAEMQGELEAWGPPVFVTDDEEWRIAGVEHSNDQTDGVVVLSRGGGLAVRTESLSRQPQPRWVDIKNVQGASVHRPDATEADRDAVMVEDSHAVLVIDGDAVTVPILRSRQTPSMTLTSETFQCTLERAGRRLSVAGHLRELDGLRLRTLREFASARW